MKIGLLVWDYSGDDTDGPGLLEFGRRRGHDMSAFALEDVRYRRTAGAATVLLGGVDANRYDAVISRANLLGAGWKEALPRTAGAWRSRAERLSMVSAALGPRMFDPAEVWFRGCSKFLMAQSLAAGGFPVPPFRSASTVDDVSAALTEWGDVVVKPSYGLQGIDVERVTDLPAQRDLVHDLLVRYGTLICQPFHPTQYGEYRITVAGETTPINMLKLPPADTWRCKTTQGASFERFDAPDDLIDLAVRAARHMGATYAGLDILPTSDGYTILEVNPVPGFLGMFGEPSRSEGYAGIFDWIDTQLATLN
ncbi:ATP-grasp domain-containing protein [Actinocatenispora rupis]|uniref:ATP-grasp domain-containing protein n=1 Tax=Actinocatenispora rupis TaxID=519421 RepID=A0A8J3NEG5_9ACTN|nr:hypothetical protein [Actinocatenispora rupis]GID16026.1 hypothetical protein Aru02nite_69150 [Actinocatenispora rupis]